MDHSGGDVDSGEAVPVWVGGWVGGHGNSLYFPINFAVKNKGCEKIRAI
jgi:hypothetical protein